MVKENCRENQEIDRGSNKILIINVKEGKWSIGQSWYFNQPAIDEFLVC